MDLRVFQKIKKNWFGNNWFFTRNAALAFESNSSHKRNGIRMAMNMRTNDFVSPFAPPKMCNGRNYFSSLGLIS
jgi:hypothetical protein